MLVRMIDYVGNEGGGVRFAAELLTALAAANEGARFEVVSTGRALGAYRQLLQGARVPGVRFTDVPPRITADGWRFDVDEATLGGCDVAWLPWVHRHRVADAYASRVVGSFHDTIVLTEPSLRSIFGRFLADEEETTARWLASGARVVVSSRATVAALGQRFGARPDRFDVIPVSGAHADPASLSDDVPLPAWTAAPFVLCPANISPHKNHETLLAGVARWGARHPLVLTGSGTDLVGSPSALRRYGRALLAALKLAGPGRAAQLREAARRLGFRRGESLLPLGYVPDDRYYAMLRRAWALVMPTLAEGGGSFPVEEALRFGVPVICSDIPVIREHMERLGAHVLWFAPRDPAALASRLAELEGDYPQQKARAVAQVATLRRRSWSDVASEYRDVFAAVAPAAPPAGATAARRA